VDVTTAVRQVAAIRDRAVAVRLPLAAAGVIAVCSADCLAAAAAVATAVATAVAVNRPADVPTLAITAAIMAATTVATTAVQRPASPLVVVPLRRAAVATAVVVCWVVCLAAIAAAATAAATVAANRHVVRQRLAATALATTVVPLRLADALRRPLPWLPPFNRLQRLLSPRRSILPLAPLANCEYAMPAM
jgi:hypothetical protein